MSTTSFSTRLKISTPEQPKIVHAILAERARQLAKWGPQTHPNLCPTLTYTYGGLLPHRYAEDLEIPTATRAKQNCERDAEAGNLNWGVILVEEVAEAVESAAHLVKAHSPEKLAALKAELVQVAAVAFAWIEDLETRSTDAAN